MSPQSSARLADAARLFSGRRLTLARQVAGLRKNALADRIARTPTAVASYENGTKKPAPATVAELCLTLGVDPEFFMVGRAEESLVQTPHFRSLRSTTQIVRDQAHAYGCLVTDVAAALERYVELPARDVLRVAVPQDEVATADVEAAAADVRAAWGLGTGPAGHMIRLLETHGIVVVFSLPQSVSVDAYSIDGSVRPLIILNPAKDDYFRRRFDVAHELGHLVMHADAEPGNKTVEDQAHRFASAFLMPEEGIRHDLPSKADWSTLFALKEKWGVSVQALLMRCRQLGTMTTGTYQNAMVTLSSRGWRRQEPGGIAAELPSLLPRSVELLDGAGYGSAVLAEQSRVPIDIFNVATSRTPTFDWPDDDDPVLDDATLGDNVTALAGYRSRE